MSQQGSVCVCVYMIVVVSNVPHFISAVSLDWERQEVKFNQANSWQTSCVLRHSLLCSMKKVKWGIVGELSKGKHCLVVGFSVFACVCYASCSFLIKKKNAFLQTLKRLELMGFIIQVIFKDTFLRFYKSSWSVSAEFWEKKRSEFWLFPLRILEKKKKKKTCPLFSPSGPNPLL